ncbi:MAG: bis(5'-nucleosyl)-tetraphosphatase (symmetrical) YqeK [Lachnospiraceae bacterium]|nr:bis(5'-nucleosyl)-tetraphosphatase (symmetrical) YqeK [Lachnospiraceae bacterium]
MNYDEITDRLMSTLKPKRYLHSVGVAYTAACLAMRYEYNIDTAYRAGLLHDCAKSMSDEELLDYCEKHDIEVSEYDRKSVNALLHSKVGSVLAKEEYNETDEKVCSAIRWHTTGKKAMDLLEKIIFVADYIEPSRRPLPNLDHIRRLAFEDIDTAVLKIYESTILYLKSIKEDDIDPLTIEAYEYYRNITEKTT